MTIDTTPDHLIMSRTLRVEISDADAGCAVLRGDPEALVEWADVFMRQLFKFDDSELPGPMYWGKPVVTFNRDPMYDLTRIRISPTIMGVTGIVLDRGAE